MKLNSKWQVLFDLGVADHAWLDKRASIAQTVDDLGDEFQAVMRAGWHTYQDGCIRTRPWTGPALGHGL